MKQSMTEVRHIDHVRTVTELTDLSAQERAQVFEFFVRFMTSEFALKARGFLRAGRNAEASADWDGYAVAIAGRFALEGGVRFHSAWSELTRDPPMKQIVRNGALCWTATTRAREWTDEQWGLMLVRRVRNNLFHGAKLVVGGAPDRARDVTLVAAAATVLSVALMNPPRRNARA